MPNSKRNTISKAKKVKKLSTFNRLFARKLRLVIFMVGFAVLGTFLLFQTFAGTHNSGQEQYLGGLINQYRSQVGVPQVVRSKCLTLAAREWAQVLGDSNATFENGLFRHSDTAGLAAKYGCGNWRGLAENIGYNGTVDTQHQAYINSQCHRWNMESRSYSSDGHNCFSPGGLNSAPYNFVGTATYTNNAGVLYTAEVFGNCPGCGGEWTAPIPETGGNTSGPAASQTFSNPAAVSWGTGRIDAFVRGTDNAIYTRVFADGGWGGWYPLGGYLTSGPTVSSWGVNRLDLFARGGDNQLWSRSWKGSGWEPWRALGGGLASAPAATSWGVNRVDVFVRGTDNQLWHLAGDGGTNWLPWRPQGGQITSAPAVESWGANRLDIVARGTDAQVWHKAWNGSGWENWRPLGGQIKDAPAIVSYTSGRLDVFARGTDNQLWTKTFSNGGWEGGWRPLGGILTSGPAASSWGTNRIDVFARGTDGQMWTRILNNGNWEPWKPVPGGQLN